ncbi:MAG: hypothetical protein JWN41_1573 [Thermoleophilia bacterium]|nr:hypothetical protein [Thermoleophilia bacterium]
MTISSIGAALRLPAASTQPGTPVGTASDSWASTTAESALLDAVTRRVDAPGSQLTQGEATALESAAYSFDASLPRGSQHTVPGSTTAIDGSNTLAQLRSADAARLSTPDFIARSQSDIAHMYDQGLAAGARNDPDVSSLGAMADSLRGSLAPDSNGLTRFDAKINQLSAGRTQLLQSMAGRAATSAELRALSENIVASDLINRERQKQEDLLKLIVSLILGQVPSSVIARLQAAGLGDLVKRIIKEAIGDGKNAPAALVRALTSIGGELGMNFGLVDEHDTVQSLAAQQVELAQRAITTDDGRAVDIHGKTVQIVSDATAAADAVQARNQRRLADS